MKKLLIIFIFCVINLNLFSNDNKLTNFFELYKVDYFNNIFLNNQNLIIDTNYQILLINKNYYNYNDFYYKGIKLNKKSDNLFDYINLDNTFVNEMFEDSIYNLKTSKNYFLLNGGNIFGNVLVNYQSFFKNFHWRITSNYFITNDNASKKKKDSTLQNIFSSNRFNLGIDLKLEDDNSYLEFNYLYYNNKKDINIDINYLNQNKISSHIFILKYLANQNNKLSYSGTIYYKKNSDNLLYSESILNSYNSKLSENNFGLLIKYDYKFNDDNLIFGNIDYQRNNLEINNTKKYSFIEVEEIDLNLGTIINIFDFNINSNFDFHLYNPLKELQNTYKTFSYNNYSININKNIFNNEHKLKFGYINKTTNTGYINLINRENNNLFKSNIEKISLELIGNIFDFYYNIGYTYENFNTIFDNNIYSNKLNNISLIIKYFKNDIKISFSYDYKPISDDIYLMYIKLLDYPKHLISSDFEINFTQKLAFNLLLKYRDKFRYIYTNGDEQFVDSNISINLCIEYKILENIIVHSKLNNLLSNDNLILPNYYNNYFNISAGLLIVF